MLTARKPWQKALERWQLAGLIDAATAARIDAFESGRAQKEGAQLPVVLVWMLGGILLAAGTFLFVAAHWDNLSPGRRFALVLLMCGVFHLTGALLDERRRALAVVLHAVGTAALGAGIFLSGQIFHLEEHWPGAFLLWALGAWMAWAILRDWPQLAWAAILTPWWLVGEWIVAAGDALRDTSLPAAGLTLLAIVYLSARQTDDDPTWRQALAWIGGLAILPSTAVLCSFDWHSRGEPVAGAVIAIGWVVALGLPLLVASVLTRRLPWEIGIAAVWVALLVSTRLEDVDLLWKELGPYVLCIAGSAVMAMWGLRDTRAERINLGVAGFGITVLAFYFTNVMDKLGRSISLLGLGALFLLLGWVLSKARRRLLDRLEETEDGGGA